MGRKGKNILLLSAALALALLSGCGTEAKNLSKGKGPLGKQEPKKCQGEFATYHQLTLILKNSIPVKLGLEINGNRELDECQELPKSPPVVHGERDGKKFTFAVMHKGAYPQPPAGISFKLLNLGNCSGSETLVFGIDGLPLEFITDYPHGTSCPGRTFAAKQIFQP